MDTVYDVGRGGARTHVTYAVHIANLQSWGEESRFLSQQATVHKNTTGWCYPYGSSSSSSCHTETEPSERGGRERVSHSGVSTLKALARGVCVRMPVLPSVSPLVRQVLHGGSHVLSHELRGDPNGRQSARLACCVETKEVNLKIPQNSSSTRRARRGTHGIISQHHSAWHS